MLVRLQNSCAPNDTQPSSENSRIFCFCSYFYPEYAIRQPLRHYAANLNLKAKEIIFVPLNINDTHWTLVACDVRRKNFTYYDSIRMDSTRKEDAYLRLTNVRNALAAMCHDKAMLTWNTIVGECPLQRKDANIPASPPRGVGGDCGLHVLLTARHIANGSRMSSSTYTSADAKALRAEICRLISSTDQAELELRRSSLHVRARRKIMRS